MRIGMILDNTFPPDPRVENEAVSLLEEGHSVFLFCLKYTGNEGDEVVNGIQVVRYLSNKFIYKVSALAYTFPFYRWLIQPKIEDFLVSNQIEVIHIHDLPIAKSVFKANSKLKLPIVLDLHENRPEIMKFYPHLNSFPGNVLIAPSRWKTKEEEYVCKADATIVVTQEAKEHLLNRVDTDASRIVVVPNTVRTSFYSDPKVDETISEPVKEKFTILYLGDTGLRRGLLEVIEAIPQLKETIPNVLLRIIGKSKDDSIYVERIKALKIEAYVWLEGWQEEIKFPSFIESSAVCISPLHRNVHHDTTFANKLFQYMSLAKPVLVSDAIAQKRLILEANSGLVHKEKNTEDFANKVIELYRNPEFAATLGANGRRFIEEEFYWEKTSEKLIQLYENLND